MEKKATETPKKTTPKKYAVTKPFIDKVTKKSFGTGDAYTAGAERLEELSKLGFIAAE